MRTEGVEDMAIKKSGNRSESVVQSLLSAQELDPKERIIISLIGAEGPSGQRYEPIPGLTWLQKEVFLVLRRLEGDEGVRSSFEPHKLGMFSEEVDHLLQGLIADGFVSRASGSKLTLSPEGKRLADEVLTSGKSGVITVREVKELLNDLEYGDLITYVYSAYPGWDSASEVKHYLDDKGRRERLAHRLYDADKISVERAAQVAGTSVEKFAGGHHKRTH